MQLILVSCGAPFRSILQKDTGPVRVMTHDGGSQKIKNFIFAMRLPFKFKFLGQVYTMKHK